MLPNEEHGTRLLARNNGLRSVRNSVGFGPVIQLFRGTVYPTSTLIPVRVSLSRELEAGLFDDVIPLRRRFRMHSEDPAFRVTWRGGGRFLLSGEVSSEPTTELDVDTPSASLEVPLAHHSLPEHAVTMLRRSLPRDVRLTQRRELGGVEITLQEVVVPAAKPPRLRVLSTDLVQRVKQLEENRVEFIGGVGADCHLTIMCDTRRITISLHAGTSAATTAVRVGASVPRGYRALVDGPTVAVWKDADFFEQVA